MWIVKTKPGTIRFYILKFTMNININDWNIKPSAISQISLSVVVLRTYHGTLLLHAENQSHVHDLTALSTCRVILNGKQAFMITDPVTGISPTA